MHFILIGNFLSDKQESMDRFAQMLHTGFSKAGYESEIWYPLSFFSRGSKSTIKGLGKWLGYIDKWIVFPIVIRWRLLHKSRNNRNVYFHICDHSNAPYIKYLPVSRTSITCHDVLAIRGSMGYEDAYCPSNGLGKYYQKWILYHLTKAKLLGSVSLHTLNQLKDLVHNKRAEQKNWQVIYNSFNANFEPMGVENTENLLQKVGLGSKNNFILHVGSGLPRKNRKLLLEMVSYLGNEWQGSICFAGQALGDELIQYSQTLGIQERVISIVKPDHATLQALYSACNAFVFPSFSEGFGWPIIEAQACGAPVITSNIEPMPEVSGGAAMLANPYKPKTFADALVRLNNDKSLKADLIHRGLENCSRFESKQMMEAYLNLYGIKPVTSQSV